MAPKKTTNVVLRRLLSLNTQAYVPVDEYNALASRVSALEKQLLIPTAAVFQVVNTNNNNQLIGTGFTRLESGYVSQEEFDDLKTHVEEIEAIVNNHDSELFIVQAG